MIFNMVFGIWILLFLAVVTVMTSKESLSDTEVFSCTIILGICLAALTLMAIISKFK